MLQLAALVLLLLGLAHSLLGERYILVRRQMASGDALGLLVLKLIAYTSFAARLLPLFISAAGTCPGSFCSRSVQLRCTKQAREFHYGRVPLQG